jgi:hypothetical protein
MSLRRRIASLVLLVGAVLVGAHLLSARDKLVPVAMTYALPAGVVRLEVEIRRPGGGETVARFMSRPGGKRELRHTTRVPPGELEAEIELEWAQAPGGGDPSGPSAGATQRFTRRFHAERDANVRLELR